MILGTGSAIPSYEARQEVPGNRRRRHLPAHHLYPNQRALAESLLAQDSEERTVRGNGL